jgi:hypothetical protein
VAWRIEFDADRKVICLAFAGHVSNEDVRDSSIAVISMLAEKGTRNIMTDFTDVTRLDISVLGVFEMPEAYKSLGLRGSFREAIVSRSEQSTLRAKIEFYETVCVNRGNQVRTFEHASSALDWLAPD